MSPKEGRGLGARQDQQPELWHRCTLVMSFQKHWVKPRKRRYYEVYDRVSALFDRQIEEYGKERFTQRLAEFRALKAAVPPPPSPPPPKARPPPPVDTSIPPPPIASLPPPNATAAATAAAAADNATLPARRRALLKTVTVPKPHSRLQVSNNLGRHPLYQYTHWTCPVTACLGKLREGAGLLGLCALYGGCAVSGSPRSREISTRVGVARVDSALRNECKGGLTAPKHKWRLIALLSVCQWCYQPPRT